jgi:hypothetical protein
MQQIRVSNLAFELAMAIAGALVALTAGFAAVAFVSILGLTILGSYQRRGERRRLREAGPVGRIGLSLLAGGCLAPAALAPWEIRLIAHGLAPITPAAVTRGALGSPWVLGPVYQGFSVLSPSWLAIELPLLVIVVVAVAWVASGGRLTKVRRVPAWRSATAGVVGESRYTEFAYANPTRRVLANVLRTRAELRRLDRGESLIAGRVEDETAELGYSVDVVEVVEQYVYSPVRQRIALLGRLARRLQSGRLEAYLAYMLVALVALIVVVLTLT